MHWTVRSLLSWLILTVAPMSVWCQTTDNREVAGRLLFDRPTMNCDMIPVELEVVDLQPVAVTYTDSACAFRFSKVPPGTYNIHVNIDGFQEVRHDVSIDTRFGGTAMMTVAMTAAPGRHVRGAPPTSNGPLNPSVDITELLDQYPSKAVSLYNKAIGNRKKGNNAEAIKQLEDAIKIAPKFYQAHNTLGLAYRDTEQRDKAEEHFLLAHEINRTSVEPLINLGSLYLDENQPELAEQMSREAVEKNSRSAPALFNLGVSLYRIAHFDQAETALLKALQIAPKMFQIRLALVNVYLKMQRFDNVMDQLNAYLVENPKGEARDQVERLKSQLLAKRQDR